MTAIAVADGSDTPAGIVAAINSGSTKVSASLLTVDANSSQFRIVLSGDTGSTNSFVISSGFGMIWDFMTLVTEIRFRQEAFTLSN